MKKLAVITIILTLNLQLLTFDTHAQGVGVNNDGAMPVAGTMLDVKGATDDNTTYGMQVKNSSGTAIMVVRSEGNVGIGTTDPRSELHLGGNLTTGWNYSHAMYSSAWSNPTQYIMRQTWDATNGDNLYLGVTGNSTVTNVAAIRLTRNTGIHFGKGNATSPDISTEHMRIDQNGNVGIGTSSPTAGLDVSGRTVKFSNDYAVYRWNFGGGTDLNWKNIATVAIGTGNWSAVSFEVKVYNAGSNHGASANGQTYTYNVSLRRSGSTQDSYNDAIVVGPSTEYIRAVKTSTGNYELQVRQPVNYRHIKVEAKATSSLGSVTTTYADSPADGSTSGTIYTATAGLSGSANYILNQTGSDQTAGFRITGNGIFNGGNVGIGNTTLAYKLDVTGEITSRSANAFRMRNSGYSVFDRNDNSNYYMLLTNNGDPDGSWNALRPFRINLASGDVYLGNGALYVDHGANVGVGTSSPTAKLEISGAGSSNIDFLTTGRIRSTGDGSSGSGGMWVTSDNKQFVGDLGSGIGFWVNTAGSSLIVEEVTGNVGIGMTTPTSKLEVNGKVEVGRHGIAGQYNSTQVQGIWSIGNAYQVDISGTNDFGNQYGIAYAHTNAGTSGTKKPISGFGHQILFTNNGNRNAAISLSNGNGYFAGNVGIGDTTPEQKLKVNGRIKSNGVNETSDERLKKNVKVIPNALSSVEQMQGVFYNWKTPMELEKESIDTTLSPNTDRVEVGFIAQELEKIVPELVDTDNEGYKSVQYSKVVALLTEAIKDLKTELDNERAANEQQQELIESLEARLKKHEVILNQQTKHD